MYKAHTPEKLPPKLNKAAYADDLADAQYELGKLQEAQKRLGNPGLLIAPLTAKEAEVSSKIEGTQTTSSDVFVFEAGGEPKYSDTRQVSNYRIAMTIAQQRLADGKTITPHLIRELHQILLNEVPHTGRVGSFRSDQNYIAEKKSDPIENALYIPPVPTVVQGLIENLVSYIESEEEKAVVTAGVAHYQFEAIHPFDDGNGRIGRLLIPLILVQKSQLSTPIIYLSGYFESKRDEYREALHKVDTSREIEPWLCFYLKGVTVQAKETGKLIDQIETLHSKTLERLTSKRSVYSAGLVNFIFEKPIFTIPEAVRGVGATRITTVGLLRELVNQKAIRPLPLKSGRASLYAFEELLALIR